MAVAVGKMDQALTDGRSHSKVVIDSEGNITDLNAEDGQLRDGKRASRPPPLEVFSSLIFMMWDWIGGNDILLVLDDDN